MVDISNIRKMELHEIQAKLEMMTQEDLARTLFWLEGFMSEQDGEFWDKFCEGLESCPYFLFNYTFGSYYVVGVIRWK